MSSARVSRLSIKNQSRRFAVNFGHWVPCAVEMAANIGLASSNVRVERAMKACRKARWQLPY